MTNVTLRQLRTLAAIRTHGKIAAAAKVLGLTAPALTLQLKQLEGEAGVFLFDRTAQGMRPTAAGLAFLEAAQAIFARLEGLEDELDAIRGVRRGTLAVGVVSTAQYFAPQLVSAFADAFPQIEVKLHLGSRTQTIARLKTYEADMMLTTRPPKDVSVRAVPFARYRVAVAAAPGHPLAARRGLGMDDLREETFLVREHPSGLRFAFERFIAHHPELHGQSIVEMDTNSAIAEALEAELGIALVATHTVAAEIEAGRLVLLDVAGLPLERQWFAVTRSGRATTPVMATFLAFLAENGPRYFETYDAFDPAL